ncbi:MAG: serpin family protein [Bacteroidales bacterium]|nr:serpin family protein [Bacteroidales bacterium]MDT8374811.1 serpin family protein [Bacteroidales bacterium]
MKNQITGLAVLLIAAVTVMAASCERQKDDPLPGDPVPIELTLKQKEVVDSANKFAFDIFKPLIGETKGSENLMISPFSITSALSMVLNGAAGETFDAVRHTLRYDARTIEEVNETYLRLMKEMVPVDPRVVMEIANSVWVEKRLTVKQPFIDALKIWYLAEARNIDVTDPDAVDMVNYWIEEKTHDKIQDMLDYLSPDLAMLLINAIYFNGKWRYQFDAEDTQNRPFYITPGESVQVPMMYQEENFAVTGTENATLVELPYGQGNYSMVVMLPDEGVSLTEASATLNSENWAEWMHQLSFSTTEVHLSLPKFEYEYKRELKDDLAALGMGIAFSGAADFSNITDQGIFISRVIHQTYIRTDEEGTEAAAATVVEFELTTMPSTTVVNVNRPFLYFIRETTTGTIVFMGQVVDPR